MDNNHLTTSVDAPEASLFTRPLNFQGKNQRAPLVTGSRSYYRSKIFTASGGTNLLLSAAAPLLSLIARLPMQDSYADISSLYQNLVHEIYAFEHQAYTLGYRSETILVARYILCATLDEIIEQTTWGKADNWAQHKLLITFQKEQWGGERFYIILDRLCEDPALHIDLLELIYLCLSLGFEGKYRTMDRGQSLREEIIDNLYQCIRWQRDELKKELLIQDTTETNLLPLTVTASTEPLPTWLLYSFVAAIILTLFTVFNHFINLSASPLYQTLHMLSQTL